MYVLQTESSKVGWTASSEHARISVLAPPPFSKHFAVYKESGCMNSTQEQASRQECRVA